ncbi:MAG: hypothetical protein ABEL51_15805 [Salinibacter sp.]
MHNGPYRSRHSVWVNVFAIVFVGALFLGGAGYLLRHADTATNGFSAETARSGGGATGPPTARSGRFLQRPGAGASRGGASSPLLSDRSGTGLLGTDAPFSESWRREATPSLSGPPASSGGSAGGTASGAAPQSEGPSIADARPGGATGMGGTSYESADRSGTDWRAEARRLGGQARALSGALRQLERNASSENDKASMQSGTAGTRERAKTGDRDVPNPPNVPIGDHLHWLAVAGLLWGAWRIGRGA